MLDVENISLTFIVRIDIMKQQVNSRSFGLLLQVCRQNQVL